MNVLFRSLLGHPPTSQARRPSSPRLRVETLEEKALMAAPVLTAIPNQTLTTNQSVLQIPLMATDADGDPLTYSAQAAGTEAYFLAKDIGLKAVTRPVNWGKTGERWFRGGADIYFLQPNGEFHRWDGTANMASGPLVATLDPVYFFYPTLLTKPSNQDIASLLNRQLGLVNIASPIPNTLGMDEKWLGGSSGMRFFIKPDGSLFRATGSPLGRVQTFLIQLPTTYYNDLTLLANAMPKKLDLDVSGTLLQIKELAGATGPFVVQVKASDGQLTDTTTFQVTPANNLEPQLPAIEPAILAAGENTITLDATATDANGDTLTYSVRTAANDAYFLASDLGLKPSTRLTNYGGAGERWFQGNDGLYFLKPSGDLHRWDGTSRQASGALVANLPPVYFYYPDLLTKPSEQDISYVLDRRLGLSPAATPATNTLGLDEKWFTTSTSSTVRFFLTPDGSFYRRVGKSIVWMADIGAGYYAQPARLYGAARDRFSASVDANGQVTVTVKPNFIGELAVQIAASDGLHVSKIIVPVTQSAYISPNAPRVVGAIATGNRKVQVSFSQPMNSAALNPANYQISQAGGSNGIALLATLDAQFIDRERTTVELTTLSQNSANYTVAVVNVKDLGGAALASPVVSQGVLVDPTRATFAGRPPSAVDVADTDSDGLTDHEEQRGWEVTVTMLNGATIKRWVTSDPLTADSDNDGLSDAQEANLGIDPRDLDTDDDQLTDFQEFNEIFSDPAKQDTDGDTLDDSLEFNFFHTSPFEADTEGDQTPDGVEILLGSRNPRIADIPTPGIEVGEVDLQLDVRFTAENSLTRRELESKSVSSTLTQTESKELANTDARSNEFNTKIGYEQGWSVAAGENGVGVEGTFTSEFGYTGQWTSSFTATSARSTQREARQSLQTDAEVSEGEMVRREVVGATMKVGLSIRALSGVAFTVKNLQVTAFLPDPTRSGRLRPIATLIPDAGVQNEFTLGPLVPERGPFVFKSDQVFPALVERLMFNPQGLVFKVANYDLTDESGRNFAFSSQDINDRTAPVIIDYGFGDADAGGPAGTTERLRVATNTGRIAVDTNGDQVIDDNDHPVVFDPNTGEAVGITLDDALQNVVGLTKYDESTTPSSALTSNELLNSYSTIIDANGVERLWRVRNVSKDLNNPLKTWIVYTSNGIDGSTNFSDLLLNADDGITLKFLQDLDDDGVDAVQEYSLGSSDTKTDTDMDGLDDGVEVYGRIPDPNNPNNTLQWTVNVQGRDSYRAFSSPARTDTDNDGVSDFDEFNRFVMINVGGQMQNVRQSLDPSKPDTDGDGVTDYDEIHGYQITLVNPPTGSPAVITRTSDPLNPDTDGDTLLDGDEQTLGTDPRLDDAEQVLDNDGDGLLNFQEDLGWDVQTEGLGLAIGLSGSTTTVRVTSNKNSADTDGDGLTDREEKLLGTDPTHADTDSDQLSDMAEVTITPNPTGPRIITPKTNPNDIDTDNDLRNDGVEVTTPIRVNVFGQAPRDVFSDPLQADADGDGLVDSEEATYGTDPSRFDTDEDNPGLSDKREVELGTDPLRRDQKVRVTLTQVQLQNFTRIDESNPADRTLEIVGELFIGNDNDPNQQMYFSFSSDMENNDVVSLTNHYFDVRLYEGETLRISSVGFVDQDAPNDDPYQDSTTTYNGLVTATSGTLTSMAAPATPGNIDSGSVTGSSIVTSALSRLNFRVEPLQFHPCFSDGKLPINGPLFLVSTDGPSGDFRLQ